jgi:hypothetical protein
LIATPTTKAREWATDTSTVLRAIDFNVDLHDMDCRIRATFSNAVLQWLLGASTEVLIITLMMMTSSSSAYGSSFHDNGGGNDNKRSFITPGKRKSNCDDDNNGDDTPKGNQTERMSSSVRCKGWCGHTTPWHQEQIGSELQAVGSAS